MHTDKLIVRRMKTVCQQFTLLLLHNPPFSQMHKSTLPRMRYRLQSRLTASQIRSSPTPPCRGARKACCRLWLWHLDGFARRGWSNYTRASFLRRPISTWKLLIQRGFRINKEASERTSISGEGASPFSASPKKKKTVDEMSTDKAIVAASAGRDSDTHTHMDIATQRAHDTSRSVSSSFAPASCVTCSCRPRSTRADTFAVSALVFGLGEKGTRRSHRRRPHKDADVLPVIAYHNGFGPDGTGAMSTCSGACVQP